MLSLYLDLDPRRFPTPATREAELSALLGKARRQNAGADAQRVQTLLEENRDLVRGARALAVFSSADADILEAVKLSREVEPMVVIDTVPWLEPIASMVASGDWGVAVLSRSSARLLRGGPKALAEFDQTRTEVHRRHSQGGWSQARFQRGIEQEVSTHIKEALEHLLRAHRRRPLQHLVIVASEELQPVIEQGLHSDLQRVLTGFVEADLEDASPGEIVAAIAPVVEQADRNREASLLFELEEAIATGGHAVAGLDEVLAMLQRDRIDTLLIAAGARLTAGRCPRCGSLFADPAGRCRHDDSELEAVDAIEHAVEAAGTRSAEVVVITHDPEALAERGSIAALLRW